MAEKQRKSTGRPWAKGESGNPKGRPKTGLAAAEMVRLVGGEVVEYGGQSMTRLEAVIRRLFVAAIQGDPKATQVLLDRGWGKVPQALNIDWKGDLIGLIREGRLPFEVVEEELGRDLAAELFVGAGVAVGEGGEAAAPSPVEG